MAGSIAYHAFVSLLPLLVLLLVIFSSIGNETLEHSLISITQAILTPGTNDVLLRELKHVHQSTGLSLLGIAVLLWGPFRIFLGLDTAFSDVYDTERRNTVVDQIFDAIVVLLTFGLAIVVATLVEAVIPSYGSSSLAWIVQQLLLVFGLVLTFFPMYYVFPDTDVSVVEILPGVLLAAIGLTVSLSLFRLYVQFSARSPDSNLIASVILLLTWLYFSGLVILLGVVVNAVLSNRSRDVSIDPVIGSGSERTDERSLDDNVGLTTPSPSAEEIDTKEARLAHPSGWFYLTQHDNIPILIDALLDLPPGREFNKTELAEHAGVTRRTVGNYIHLLIETDIVERVPDTSPTRYQMTQSNVVKELFELNSALSAVGE